MNTFSKLPSVSFECCCSSLLCIEHSYIMTTMNDGLLDVVDVCKPKFGISKFVGNALKMASYKVVELCLVYDWLIMTCKSPLQSVLHDCKEELCTVKPACWWRQKEGPEVIADKLSDTLVLSKVSTVLIHYEHDITFGIMVRPSLQNHLQEWHELLAFCAFSNTE